MKTLNNVTSACRSCRYYQPEGRRGGLCQQLSAPVRGSWKACSLALPPFAPSWETLEGIMILPDDKAILPEVLASNCTLGYSEKNLPEEKIASQMETLNAKAALV